MFPFHERTQRRFCRCAFVLFCVLPTIAICVWAVRIHLPSHRSATSNRLSYLLGMRVTVPKGYDPNTGLPSSGFGYTTNYINAGDQRTGQLVARFQF